MAQHLRSQEVLSAHYRVREQGGEALAHSRCSLIVDLNDLLTEGGEPGEANKKTRVCVLHWSVQVHWVLSPSSVLT